MERFLNGMEPDAPVLLKAWPWKALGTAIFFGASAFLLWFWA